MDFDVLLENFELDGQKEVVALAIYYLEEYQGRSGATPSEIGGVLEDSRSSVNTSSVSTYISRLDDWVTGATNGGYQLTHNGRTLVKEALDQGLMEDPRDDLFLNTTELNEEDYYERLVNDINKSYQNHIPDASLVLTRKLFEHLIYKILMGHFSGEDASMYFDTDSRRSLGFEQLVSNFEDNITILRQYSRDLDKDVVETVEWARNQGNQGAHSIRVDVTEDELEDKSNEATRAAEILYDVWAGVRIRAKESDNGSD
jgi:hypothetical protein